MGDQWARYLEGDEIPTKIGLGQVGIRWRWPKPPPPPHPHPHGMGWDRPSRLKFFWEKLGDHDFSWFIPIYPDLSQLILTFPNFSQKLSNFSRFFRPKTPGKIQENPNFPRFLISTIEIKWLSRSQWSRSFGILFQSQSQFYVWIGMGIPIFLAHDWWPLGSCWHGVEYWCFFDASGL